MIARHLPLISAFRVGLALAVLAPMSFLGAQTNPAPGAATAAKPKPKMVPRGLPGMGPSNSASSQSGPSAEDIQATEASAAAKVPLFRPAAARVSNAPASGMTGSSPSQAAAPAEYSDRARITAIRRRGTFPAPQSQAAQAPVLVNGAPVSSSAASTETVPAALPPGRIRVIPKDMIKIGTPAPTP